ncbi:hypothetical protein PRK78_006388 [Emydomyces testavorans]|uniref:NECAP PHear domain-containing protein n=1 Tax=Emydomyces testavorans TaxID=2070801 RepID=A0AAF0DLB2_9EURO|nr:hypothetical protein PRK78_006388 [Emydomyces testavorans]
MSSIVDPATGRPLPADAIQRVLYVCHPIHVYAIPPLMSMKGYTAAHWTAPDPSGKTKEIFTARLRILETAIPLPTSPARTRPGKTVATSAAPVEPQETVKTDILLEDASSGDLFAAAPYTDAGVVEHAIDSSRFFALRVVGEGKKAVLGIGFEDRSEAFDFGVALQEARKVLGFGAGGASATVDAQKPPTLAPAGAGRRPGIPPSRGRVGAALGGRKPPRQQPQVPEKPADTRPKDYSLKPGQTITVNIGGRQRPEPVSRDPQASDISADQDQKALFSIAPPPGTPSSKDTGNFGNYSAHSVSPFIPPPPGTKDTRTDRRRRPVLASEPKEAQAIEQRNDATVNDDDEFGEFQ